MFKVKDIARFKINPILDYASGQLIRILEIRTDTIYFRFLDEELDKSPGGGLKNTSIKWLVPISQEPLQVKDFKNAKTKD